ncbi:hypothetical protein BJF79_32325 [Actinomadura sp. CNU-125]|uniref:hypothetical protein n=1 Tax=Actinomadura sp. CNU-125 TaxID=1904961 RepID=UPI00095D3D56|nr:hypothetical protein [Actinomadura sp. CNU-125]OLT35446.1 hypothetical protein BJF79_32325 [Actinomadura sp. CNU-125]
MRTRIGLVAALGTTLLLSGCIMPGSDDESDAAEPPPAPTTSAPAPAPPQASPPGGGAQVTPPGTALRVGQRAVVPYERAGVTGTLGITVTAIEPGDQATFRQRFGARAAGMVPFYIRYTVENVGGTDLSRGSAPLLEGVGPGGSSTGAVVIGTMDGCERGRPDDSFAVQGAKYESCRLQAARQGGTVAGAAYEEDEGGYRDSPVIWTN